MLPHTHWFKKQNFYHYDSVQWTELSLWLNCFQTSSHWHYHQQSRPVSDPSLAVGFACVGVLFLHWPHNGGGGGDQAALSMTSSSALHQGHQDCILWCSTATFSHFLLLLLLILRLVRFKLFTSQGPRQVSIFHPCSMADGMGQWFHNRVICVEDVSSLIRSLHYTAGTARSHCTTCL